ncbi:MAG: hypothetical protein EZS28_024263 [Streblomastix strix]|uniref:Uncharacterized protein n=1 Tax=Streblomastix strix TaxID=222440 RepID=A0A5J4VCK7_9EUKA|nr:MAG: hypothetical protein EZS28_024263 [Streblomastix strix]
MLFIISLLLISLTFAEGEKDDPKLPFLVENLFTPMFLTPQNPYVDRFFSIEKRFSPYQRLTLYLYAPFEKATVHVRRIWDGRNETFNPEEYDFACNWTDILTMKDSFPKELLSSQMLDLTGKMCQLTYNQFQLTPGAYHVRARMSPKKLNELKKAFDEKKEAKKKLKEEKFGSKRESESESEDEDDYMKKEEGKYGRSLYKEEETDSDSEEEEEEEEESEGDEGGLDKVGSDKKNIEQKEKDLKKGKDQQNKGKNNIVKPRRMKDPKYFSNPIFIAPQLKMDKYQLLPFVLLPLAFGSPILSQFPQLGSTVLAALLIIHLIELFTLGITVQLTPNIIAPVIDHAQLLGGGGMPKGQYLPPKVFITSALLPSLTRLEVILPVFLLLTYPFLSRQASKRRKEGMEDEGKFHTFWMSGATLSMFSLPVSRFLSTLYVTTPMMTQGLSLVMGLCAMSVMGYDRNTQRRTMEQEKKYEKEQREKEEEEEKKKEKEKKEREEKEGKKDGDNKGDDKDKEIDYKLDDAKTRRMKRIAAARRANNKLPPYPEELGDPLLPTSSSSSSDKQKPTSKETEEMKKRILSRLNEIGPLSTKYGGINLASITRSLGSNELIEETLRQHMEEEKALKEKEKEQNKENEEKDKNTAKKKKKKLTSTQGKDGIQIKKKKKLIGKEGKIKKVKLS